MSINRSDHATLITVIDNKDCLYLEDVDKLRSFLAHPTLLPKPLEIDGGYYSVEKVLDYQNLQSLREEQGDLVVDPPAWYMEHYTRIGPDVARIIDDERMEILLLFIINSSGGEWEASDFLLKRIPFYLNRRNKSAGTIAIVGDHALSAFARFLEHVDRCYAFDDSTILFHDSHVIHPFISEKMKNEELICNGHWNDTEQVRCLIRGRVHLALQQSALRKLQCAQNDQENEDNSVVFQASELGGLITETSRDAQQMLKIFEKETGILLDTTSTGLGFMFQVWSEHLNARRDLAKAASMEEAKLIWASFHKRQFDVPGVSVDTLKHIINGRKMRATRIEDSSSI